MATPESPIETARTNLLEKRKVENLAGELFHSALDLLKERGETRSILRFAKYRRLEHLVINSAEPPVLVSVESDINPERARSVRINIQEYGTVTIRREGSGARRKFSASTPLSFNTAKSDQLRGCLAAIRQVAAEVKEH